MLPVRLLAALAAIFCLSACAFPIGLPGVPQGHASSQSSDEAQVEQDPSDEADPGTEDPGSVPSTAPTEEWSPSDTSGIQSRGADSKECKASTELARTASAIGMDAATGGVTQATYDKIFTPAIVNDIPADASAQFEALRNATKALIGDDPLADDTNVETWTYAVLDWQYVIIKVCS